MLGPQPEVQLEGGASLDLSEGSVARSLRVAPPLIGLDLLEAAILEQADPDDRDGDGISGRPHWLEEGERKPRLGRFGWKAIATTVRDQTAAVFLNDMGLTSQEDIGWRKLDLVAYHSQTLGAPRTALPASSPGCGGARGCSTPCSAPAATGRS